MDNRSRLTTAADVPLTDAEAAAGGCDTVQLRVLVDSSVIEAYAMRGRAHFNTRAYPQNHATSNVVGLGWVPATAAAAAMPAAVAVAADVRVWSMA